MFHSENKLSPRQEQLKVLVQKKGLDPAPFLESKISLKDSIDKHASWAFNSIYRYPYLKVAATSREIARYHHGVQHALRATLYAPILANLNRRHGDKRALALTAEDLHLIQIAILFHDSAREDEEEDLWDAESGLLLFFYLTETLQVPVEKAKLLAEAVTNKDAIDVTKTESKEEPDKNAYYLELVIKEEQVLWEKAAARSKNIYQELIHDADCLDVIRVRPHFIAEYLDFYKHHSDRNQLAFKEMVRLHKEIFSLVAYQGDRFTFYDTQIKRQYEHDRAYEEHVKSLEKKQYFILWPLFANGKLLAEEVLKQMTLLPQDTYDPKKPLTEENLQAAMRNHQVLLRSIAFPCAISKKSPQETLLDIELRKMARRPDKPTRKGRLNKLGNPERSVSLGGSELFSNVAGVIIDPDLQNIHAVYQVDKHTGWHKKNASKKLTLKEKEDQLCNVIHRDQLGGSSELDSVTGDFFMRHNEILYRITHFDAFCYTNEPNISNIIGDQESFTPSPFAHHHYTPALEAIYAQQLYQRKYGVKLRIFKYSAVHMTCELMEFTHENIVAMWVQVVEDYSKRNRVFVVNQSVNNIKIMAVFGASYPRSYAKNLGSADSLYDESLKTEINTAILKIENEVTDKYINEYLSQISWDYFLENAAQRYVEGSGPIELYCLAKSVSNDKVMHVIKEKLTTEIKNEMKKDMSGLERSLNCLHNLKKLVNFLKVYQICELEKSFFEEVSANIDLFLMNLDKMKSHISTKEIFEIMKVLDDNKHIFLVKNYDEKYRQIVFEFEKRDIHRDEASFFDLLGYINLVKQIDGRFNEKTKMVWRMIAADVHWDYSGLSEVIKFLAKNYCFDSMHIIYYFVQFQSREHNPIGRKEVFEHHIEYINYLNYLSSFIPANQYMQRNLEIINKYKQKLLSDMWAELNPCKDTNVEYFFCELNEALLYAKKMAQFDKVDLEKIALTWLSQMNPKIPFDGVGEKYLSSVSEFDQVIFKPHIFLVAVQALSRSMSLDDFTANIKLLQLMAPNKTFNDIHCMIITNAYRDLSEKINLQNRNRFFAESKSQKCKEDELIPTEVSSVKKNHTL